MKEVAFFIMLLITKVSLCQNYSVKGKVVDMDNGLPLPFSTVTLTNDSSNLYTTISDSVGYFNINSIPAGEYLLAVNYIGYKQNQQKIKLNSSFTLGVIELYRDSTTLDNVTIKSNIPKIRRLPDRFVLDMKNAVINKGKNALQSLNYAPGVIIGRGGVITLNGKTGTVIMINGKKLNMDEGSVISFLKGLRAEYINRVEVITNPGAAYDASGQAGIIDIYLNKNYQRGFTGSAYATYGQTFYPSYSIGTSLFYNYKNLQLYGSFNNELTKGYYRNIENIIDLVTNNKQENLLTTRSRNFSNTFRIGLNYSFAKKHNIGIEMYGLFSTDSSNSFSSTTIFPNYGKDSTVHLTTNDNNKNRTTSLNVSYSYDISSQSKLDFLVDYTKTKKKGSVCYQYQNENYLGRFLNSISDNNFDIFSSQADYSHNISKKLKLLTGAKFSAIKTIIDEGLFENINNIWTIGKDYTYKFDYIEHLLAVYSSLSYKSDKFQFLVGLRGENMNQQFSTQENFSETKLFPSFSSKYSFTKDLYLSAAYSKRVGRAPYRSLLPYYFFQSPYRISQGNPNLKSSFTDAYSLIFGFKSYSLSLSLDRMMNVIYPISYFDSQTGILYVKNQNVEYGIIPAITLSVPIKVTKWWDSYNNIILRYKKFEDPKYSLTSENLLFTYRTGNSFALPKDIRLEINALMMTPSLAGPIIHQNGGIMVDCGISKDFFNNKLSLSITADDVFGLLNNLRETTDYNGFKSSSISYMNQQKFAISLQYNFHKGREASRKSKKTINSAEQQRINEK